MRIKPERQRGVGEYQEGRAGQVSHLWTLAYHSQNAVIWPNTMSTSSGGIGLFLSLAFNPNIKHTHKWMMLDIYSANSFIHMRRTQARGTFWVKRAALKPCLMYLSPACAATVLLRAWLWLHRGLQTTRWSPVDEGDGRQPPGQALHPQRRLHSSNDRVPSQSQGIQRKRRGTLQPNGRHLFFTGR